MGFLTVVLFVLLSLSILLLIEKTTNPIAVVHILFFIIFVELLDLAGLLNEGDRYNDIAYYLLAHLSVIIYLGVFVLGMLWLKSMRLIPSPERFFKSAIRIGDAWLIAAFLGWLLMKTYLVAMYGVSAFSLYSRLAGKDIILHYTNWWETPLLGYLQAFAVGASVVYVVKVVLNRGYLKTNWKVGVAFMVFASIYVVTHSPLIGPRRFMLMLVLIALVTAAWKDGKGVFIYLLTRWRKVLVVGIVLFGAAAYYQNIRNNFSQPEIANKLLSGDIFSFVQGVAQGMLPISKDERVREETTLLRAGPLEIIYRVIQSRNDEGLGTDGKITANAFRMIMPRVIAGQDKEDINADEYLEQEMSITPDGPYIFPDVSTSLLAIFIADFGFWGIFIAPVLMLGSIAFFSNIPRRGLFSHPLMILFYFFALFNLAANVEGSLVSVLSIFRSAMILALVIPTLSLVGLAVNRKKMKIGRAHV